MKHTAWFLTAARWAARLALLAWVMVSGVSCVTSSGDNRNTDRPPPPAIDVLRVGDQVTIQFADIPNPGPPMAHRIKDDGTLTLPLGVTVQAKDKTARQVEQEIREAYVPRYYKRFTATVQTQERYFFVGGEVKQPNQYIYTPGMTVLKAIAAASGFTDFAKRDSVEVTDKDGKRWVVDCKKALKGNHKLDLYIYPDDRVNVPRRFY